MKRDYEALRQLRRVVEDAPEHLFHMRKITELADCGTAHCAIGWASVDPWFQTNKPEMCEAMANAISLLAPFTEPAAEAFGITVQQADALFGADLYYSGDPHAVSKSEVLWNIDQMLSGHQPRRYKATGDDGAPGPFVPIRAH